MAVLKCTDGVANTIGLIWNFTNIIYIIDIYDPTMNFMRNLSYKKLCNDVRVCVNLQMIKKLKTAINQPIGTKVRGSILIIY